MSGWFHMNLGDAMLAAVPLDRIGERYATFYAAPGADAAVFVRHESEGRLHCEVQVYFSPGAASLARALGAGPCARPSPAGLGLLVGPRASWSACFPQAPT